MKKILKCWPCIGMVLFGMMILYFCYGTWRFMYVDLSVMQDNKIISCAMEIISMIICLLIYYSTISDLKNLDRETMYFQLLTYFECGYLFFDEMTWVLDGRIDRIPSIIAINFLTYITPIVMMVTFWGYVQSSLGMSFRENKKQSNTLLSLAGIATGLVLLNLKFEFYYSISSSGIYQREDYFMISTILMILMFIIIALFTYRQDEKIGKRRKIITYIVLPVLSTIIMNFTFGYAFFVIAILCSILLLFVNIYKERGVELAIKEQEIKQKNQELVQSQTAMMISQIQPHFLYNTLASISMMYDIDPAKSKEATSRFASYLRTNLDSIANKKPISMQKEMDHVNNYLYLEQMRFDDLIIHVSIESYDFEIPALTIQPIVENAIKHGIMGKESGGELWIKEIEHDDYHEITIKDDGVGFDPAVKKNDGRSHVGMQNVKDRLNNMVDGDLEVKSIVGIGTLVKITIPKQEVHHEAD